MRPSYTSRRRRQPLLNGLLYHVPKPGHKLQEVYLLITARSRTMMLVTSSSRDNRATRSLDRDQGLPLPRFRWRDRAVPTCARQYVQAPAQRGYRQVPGSATNEELGVTILPGNTKHYQTFALVVFQNSRLTLPPLDALRVRAWPIVSRFEPCVLLPNNPTFT